MPNKKIKIYFAALLLACCWNKNAFAFDISGCVENYAKEHNIDYDLNNPDTLIRPIVYCHTVTGSGAESAADAADTINSIINGYALKLYGEAIAIRAKMAADAEPNSAAALAKKAMSSLLAKDKKSVIQDKVAPNYKDISKNISKIIELEAQIANLEAARLISQERDGAELFEEAEE